MKKLLSVLCVLSMLLLCLSSCTGYNSIMYDHLTDKSNYRQYKATIESIYYVYDGSQLSDNYDRKLIMNAEGAVINVLLHSKSDVARFMGVSPSDLAKECSEYVIRLELVSQSCKVLAKNGFFDVAENGHEIRLTASSLIYMDGNFFYISAITYDGTEYLNETAGMQHIRQMMNQNRSAF